LVLALACGCATSDSHVTWTLEHVGAVKGFNIPECAEVNPADGTVFVSNMFGVTRDTVGALDANGFIATLAPGGELRQLKAVRGTEAVPVHGPSGMCFFEGYLYFNDRNNLKRCPLGDPSAIEVVPVYRIPTMVSTTPAVMRTTST